MAFEEQTLSDFIEAKSAASELLRSEGVKTRIDVSFEEALCMQAISDLLQVRTGFYGLEIIDTVEGNSGSIYPLLRRFENPYRITISSLEDATYAHSRNRPARREYMPTEFGKTVFGLFIPRK